MDSQSVFLADAAATAQLGRNLADRWLALPQTARPVLLLLGDLGAGKTCLVQGLAEGLGLDEALSAQGRLWKAAGGRRSKPDRRLQGREAIE